MPREVAESKRQATTNYRFDFGIENQDASNSRSTASKIKRKAMGSMKTRLRHKKSTTVKRMAKFEVLPDKLILDLPIQTKSEANSFEPWPVRHKRHKEQQKIVSLALSPHKAKVSLPCRIMLTRFAPHELDVFDNLPSSFKYIVDAVCSIITGNYIAGKADSDKRISIACDQEKSGAYGIRIVISW